MGDVHFIVLQSNKSNTSSLAPIDKVLQNEDSTLEPVPYFELDQDSFAVQWHCPLKYGYTRKRVQFLGFTTNFDKRNPLSKAPMGSILHGIVATDGYTLR